MSKFGIIFCGYNSEDTLEESLAPFIDDDRFTVAAVSVPFAEYIDQPHFEDKTTDLIRNYHSRGDIKYFIDNPRYIKESEARNLALDCLKKEGCEMTFMVDSDESFTRQDLDNIESFIDADPDSIWWRLSLKNYVFDTKTYLKEPFCPPRIFRMKPEGLYSPSFYGDNDVQYIKSNGEPVSYLNIPNKTIPQETAWIKHYTWLDNEIGKRKVGYQKTRWGNENGCSFAWSEEKGLHFNEEYYKQNGQEIPEVKHDIL